MPSQVAVPLAPAASVPMVSSRTSVPPRAVPVRIRAVIPLIATVAGFRMVMTVLSFTPALLA